MAKIHGKKAKGSSRIKEPEMPASTDSQTPIFCLRHLKGTYCLSECEKDEKAAFADTLLGLSRRTWGELTQLSRRKAGYEVIAQDAISTGKPDVVTADVNLIRFKFCGNKVMVGFRNRAIFHVIWLDRDFTLYDHG